MRSGRRPGAAAFGLLAVAAACSRAEPPREPAGAPDAQGVEGTLPPVSAGSTTPPALPSGSAVAVPSAAAPSASSAGDPAIDWTNRAMPPLQTPALDARGRALLDAIVRDDVELARDFFFPREPFKPLKDVGDPDRYWRQLFAAYRRDVRELHNGRRSWQGASFESLRLGSPPTWVKPGEEYNKIGYYRTFNAKLAYSVEGKRHALDIHTIISWNGEWYVTHLSRVRR